MLIEPIDTGLFTLPDDPRGFGLVAGRCAECHDLHFPATPDCPYCGAESCLEEVVGREGHLHLGTVVTAPPPGYHGEVPYGFGLVDLPEGIRVISIIAETDPGRLRPGLPLKIDLRLVAAQPDDEGPVATWQYVPQDHTP